MTRYLLDTSVLSTFAPGRDAPDHVRDWIMGRSDDLHLSIISLIEVEQGIAKLQREGKRERAATLANWIADTTVEFDRNVISVDLSLSKAIGRMVDAANALGRNPGLADIAIAATAKARGLRLLTRNLRHFAPLDVDAIDPFEARP